MQTVCSNLSYGFWNYHQICSMMDAPESRSFQGIKYISQKRFPFFPYEHLGQNFTIDLQSCTEVQTKTLTLELKMKPEVY